MAGLFGFFNYNKPGPGVSKDAPQKHGFFVFLDILSRKFWNLIKINMLYVVSIILFFVPLILLLLSLTSKELSGSFFATFHVNGVKYSILTPLLLLYLLPVGLAGPATAGFTYILRNYAREEHAFLWSDYIDTIKKNFKQALAVGFINIIVFGVMAVTIPFYMQSMRANGWAVVPLAICIAIAMIFLFIHYYIYVMLITFDLKLKHLYKNAAIFALAGFGRNLLLTLAILFWALFVWVIPVLGSILVFFILPSFVGLQINFVTWPLIRRIMIDPHADKEPQEEAPSKDQPLFEDRGREK